MQLIKKGPALALGAGFALCVSGMSFSTQSSSGADTTTIEIRDAKGTPRIRLGRLPSGLYGLQFVSGAGMTSGEFSMSREGAFLGAANEMDLRS